MTRYQIISTRLQVYYQAVKDGATSEQAKELAIHVTRNRRIAKLTYEAIKAGQFAMQIGPRGQ